MKRFLLAAIALCAAALSGCTSVFFQPSRRAFADPAQQGLRCEAIKFKSADGTQLTGLFFPAEGKPLGTVVHFHGNAENMTTHFGYSAWLAAKGFNVFIFDYRGYGASEGTPSVNGLVADGVAALDHVRKIPGVEDGKIAVLAHSLGGAIAVAAVGEYKGTPPRALVLDSTFYSYKGVAAAALRSRWWSWPFSWLGWILVTGDRAPADYIGNITAPKLFLHAKNDPVVPFSQGKKLYEAAKEPKELVLVPGGHCAAFYGYRETYGPKLVEFLTGALAKTKAGRN